MKNIIAIVFLGMPVLAMGYGKADTALWNVSITPQNLFNNCIRFDIERRLSSNNWIGFGQQIYFGEVNTNDSSFGPASTVFRYSTPHKSDELSGVGFVLEDKIFLHHVQREYSGFYFDYGVAYSQLNIRYQDNTWVQYQQNGSTYYGYMITDANMKIDRDDFFFAFGLTSNNTKLLHLDITLGGVIQGTEISYSGLGPGYRNFNRYFFDFQYEGVYPLLTFQLGFLF